MPTRTSKSNKAALSLFLEATYGVAPEFVENWFMPLPSENTDPQLTYKLQVMVGIPGKGSRITLTAVLRDNSLVCLEEAYGRFFTSVTRSVLAGRNPFQIPE